MSAIIEEREIDIGGWELTICLTQLDFIRLFH